MNLCQDSWPSLRLIIQQEAAPDGIRAPGWRHLPVGARSLAGVARLSDVIARAGHVGGVLPRRTVNRQKAAISSIIILISAVRG